MKYTLLFLFFVLCNPYINGQEKTDLSQRKIIVAKDESGDFPTIQSAIDAANTEKESVLIYIKKGTYKEKLVIPSTKQHLTLVGENKDNTIITYDDYSGKPNPNSTENIRTSTSYTLLVEANNVVIENLTIENSWCEKGQAVSLHVKGSNFFIRNSN